MNNQIVKINNADLLVKEFNGQRVVTFKDIDVLHERVDGTAKSNFYENKKHFIENEDYFIITKSLKYEIPTLEIPNRGITVLTESGYLMLVKSLQDDLAWKVQRELVNNYFRAKRIVQAKLSKELQAIFMIDGKQQELEQEIIVVRDEVKD
ncbi:ORF6N domain-containing protein, partial [Clostridium tertium]